MRDNTFADPVPILTAWLVTCDKRVEDGCECADIVLFLE